MSRTSSGCSVHGSTTQVYCLPFFFGFFFALYADAPGILPLRAVTARMPHPHPTVVFYGYFPVIKAWLFLGGSRRKMLIMEKMLPNSMSYTNCRAEPSSSASVAAPRPRWMRIGILARSNLNCLRGVGAVPTIEIRSQRLQWLYGCYFLNCCQVNTRLCVFFCFF